MAGITIDGQLPDERPPAQAANYFSFTRVGTEVQLLVGYLDLKKLYEAIEDQGEMTEDEAISIPVDLSQRLVMSPQALLELRNKAQEMLEGMEALEGGAAIQGIDPGEVAENGDDSS